MTRREGRCACKAWLDMPFNPEDQRFPMLAHVRSDEHRAWADKKVDPDFEVPAAPLVKATVRRVA